MGRSGRSEFRDDPEDLFLRYRVVLMKDPKEDIQTPIRNREAEMTRWNPLAHFFKLEEGKGKSLD